MIFRPGLSAAMLALCAALALPASGIAQQTPKASSAKHRIVIQVSDDNPKTWGQALNVAENTQTSLGKENVDVQIVAFGFGLNMIKFDSPVGTRIGDLQQQGVAFRACGTTMRRMKVVKDDLYPDIPVVEAGVVEIMKKVSEGWFHIRP